VFNGLLRLEARAAAVESAAVPPMASAPHLSVAPQPTAS
jgi:hypothetical protein